MAGRDGRESGWDDAARSAAASSRSAAHARDVARGEVELAVEPELELAGPAALADEALPVGVADLEPDVELGQDGLEVEVEAAVDQVRVGRARGLGFAP